ncbi:MAG TPA: heme-binding beta-barrel domain-containing protein [Terriglobales bacterium]|nr:heme-binding beta-barrel domain-containing protein [Terriglobales bacterium]
MLSLPKHIFPKDVFTEPSDVDPNTLANLGPLTRLAGSWQASKGVDLNPKAGGPERRVFIERIDFEPIDPQANGPQLFYGLRYHIHITTAEEDITFHDQVGYWLWEPATGLVLQTVAIPRGQVALAAGQAKPDDNRFTVVAKRGETQDGICSTAFLEYGFRTDSYQIEITFNADGSWSYATDTVLTVHGQATPFAHRDQNTLTKVAEAKPNPLAAILAQRKALGTKA